MNSSDTAAPAFAELNPVVSVEDVPAASLSILDDNEIIEHSFRPSPWYVAALSVRFVAMMLLISGIAMLLSDEFEGPATLVAAGAIVAALVRLGLASLQWVSRLYVLTNRRAIRFSGVFNVRISECALACITRIELERSAMQSVLRLGTIRMTAEGRTPGALAWTYLPRPDDIHAVLTRAVHKARNDAR